MKKLSRLLMVLGFSIPQMGFSIVWNVPVMATWTDDPRSTVTLAWEQGEDGTANVRYGPIKEDGTWDETGGDSQMGMSRRHVFTLTDLQPGIRYGYAVDSSDGYEASGLFWTAPDSLQTSFRFVLHNDLQGGIHEAAAAEVAAAVIREKPDFVISTGDISDYRFGRDYLDAVASWNKFFTALSNELTSAVFQVVAGNHDEPENPDSFWHSLVELPGDKRDFSYSVGPIRFIAVDATEGEAFSRVVWLTEELQKAAADEHVQWVIPYFHRPPFSWGQRGGDDSIQKWWTPLFTKYEASLVLSGHAHTYQRTHEIGGVPYVVSGGGGGWLYEVDTSRPEIAYATSLYHAVRFDVSEGRLHLAAFDTQNRVFDEADYLPRRFVRVEPVFPRRGEVCTVWYHPAGGPLENETEIRIYAGRDEFNNVFLDEAMEKAEDGWWKISFTVPDTPKWHIAFCFKNGDASLWHNNHRQNWQTRLQRDW